MKEKTAEKIANKWIKKMQEAGLTPDQMLEVFRMARKKYEAMKAADIERSRNAAQQPTKTQ